MRDRARNSPKALARTTGAFYLLLTVAALTAEFFVRSRLIVRGDAVATAQQIVSHPSLYRMGVICDLTNLLCDAIVAVLLYRLFRPVACTIAMLAAVLRLIMVCVLSTTVVFSLAPLRLLSATVSASSLPLAQAQAFTTIALDLRSQTVNIALIFFGVHLMLVGYLAYRSAFLPRIIAILLGLAGLGYLLNSLIRFAAPGVMEPYFPYLASLWGLAEWSFTLWLLIVGIDVEKWFELAKSTKTNVSISTR